MADLGESDGVEDGPDTHEAIDMVMAANDMEIHVVDYAKAKRERELGVFAAPQTLLRFDASLLFTNDLLYFQVRLGRPRQQRKPSFTMINSHLWKI